MVSQFGTGTDASPHVAGALLPEAESANNNHRVLFVCFKEFEGKPIRSRDLLVCWENAATRMHRI